MLPLWADLAATLVFGLSGALLARSSSLDLVGAAHQRTALEARGMTCAVPGCGTTTPLEIDHVDGWATTRRTHVDQLDWLCHHTQKTNHSYRLAGPPGARTWHPPDQPVPDG